MRTATFFLTVLCLGLLATGCEDATSEAERDNGTSSGGSSGSFGTGDHCGDGVVSGTEQCDALDVGGTTCVDLGFEGGDVACLGDCTFDTVGCFTCGDSLKNGTEECDLPDLGGANCGSLGLGVGQLICRPDCTLDTQGCCVPQCSGKTCGPDGCGGQCGACGSPDACCDGTCVAAPESCSCTCVCNLKSNPNCLKVSVTNSAQGQTCTSLCQNACSLGCGGMESATGDCPLQATCD